MAVRQVAGWVAALLLLLCRAPVAPAVTIAVNTTSDAVAGGDGFTSLREAILAANILGGADTILLPAGTYTLTLAGSNEDACATGDLDITDSLTLQGESASNTILSAAGLGDRVLDLLGVAATVTVTDVTIRDGHPPDGQSPAQHGGGIRNQSILYLLRCLLRNNEAGSGQTGEFTAAPGGCGGGLFTTNYALLGYCTFLENRAGTGGDVTNQLTNTTGVGGRGGGVFYTGALSVSLADSTFVGNRAGAGGASTLPGGSVALRGEGGGVFASGMAWVEATLCTFVSNYSGTGTALPGHAGDYGAFGRDSGLFITVGSSIVAWNNGSSLASENLAPASDSGYNVLGGDPLLGVLHYNGGPTPTMAPLSGSPALDAGSPGITNGSNMVDQRGFPRVLRGRVDIGAVEDASVLWVNTTNDVVSTNDVLLSLREAIQLANAQPAIPTSVLLSNDTYTLTVTGSNEEMSVSGDLDVHGSVAVLGSLDGPTIIDGGPLDDRVFHLFADGRLSVSNLNITGGAVTGGGGGAFFNDGGLLAVSHCALYANSAVGGGGAILHAGGTTTVFQSTLADNLSALAGGAIRCSTGAVLVQHCTVVGNGVTAANGGGLSADPGASNDISITHSLVANNAAFMDGPDLSGAINSLGYNVVGLTNGCLITNDLTGNITGVVAPVAPLQNNGGPTFTVATLPGNPAIDAGNPAFVAPPAVDQRGYPRVFDTRIDIGAYEFQFTNLVVTTTNDELNFLDSTLSLREAVIIANQQPATSNHIALGAGTYVLTIAGTGEDNALTGDLDLRTRVSIAGSAAQSTVIEAGHIDRVCFVDTGSVVVFSDLTLRGGLAGSGAGLYNQGTLVLQRCYVTENIAYVYGGGIEQYSGYLAIIDSTIADNSASSPGGGGIDMVGGTVDISNSTITENFSPAGAGLYREGGNVQLYFTTVSGNQAINTAGGLYTAPFPGTIYLTDSVIADNLAPSAPDVGGSVASQGYNFVEDYSSSIGYVDTDLGGGDPALNTVAFNGGSTPTCAPRADSPLINRADPDAAVTETDTDQRGAGFPRKRGVHADIGAVEFADPDEDQDGMPDEWESAYGLDPTNALDAASDADTDPFNNLEEYLADTVPTNAASFHRILDIARGAGAQFVAVPSSTNRVYQLQQTASLEQGAWSNLHAAVTGMVGGVTVLSDADGDTSRFYRVAVRLP